MKLGFISVQDADALVGHFQIVLNILLMDVETEQIILMSLQFLCIYRNQKCYSL